MVKSMLEKLTEHYWWCEKLGIKGHAVGYHCEKFELVQSHYKFKHGAFTLKNKTETFFLWNYNPKK